MDKLRVEQVAPKEWRFVYPSEAARLDGLLDEAIELMYSEADEQAEEMLRGIINELPVYIDAYYHLGLLRQEQGEDEEALRLWRQAVQIGLDALPADFMAADNHLRWAERDNQPFLRAYNALGLAYYEQGDAGQGAEIFDRLLTLDPDDSQGVRALAILAYLDLDQPEKALAVTARYPQDTLVDTLYGRALAQFRLEQREAARVALQAAIEHYPLVAKELVKSWHKPPKGMETGGVTTGGADEAYAYWQYVGRYWRETRGALDFVREELARL